MTTLPTNDLRRLDDGPMSSMQVAAVSVTVVISALDGYDVLAA